MLYKFIIKNIDYYQEMLDSNDGPIGIKCYKRVVVRVGGMLERRGRGILNVKHLLFKIPKKSKTTPFPKFTDSGPDNTINLFDDNDLNDKVNSENEQVAIGLTESSINSNSDNEPLEEPTQIEEMLGKWLIS